MSATLPEAAPTEVRLHPRAVARRLADGDAGSLRVLITLAIIWVIFAIAHDRFLTPINLTNLALQSVAFRSTLNVKMVFGPKLIVDNCNKRC